MREILAISLIVITLTIDTLLSKFYALSYNARISVFVLITLVYTVEIYLIFRSLRIKDIALVKRNFYFNILHKTIILVQCAIAAIFFSVLLQILLTSVYYVALIASITTLSYVVAGVMMSILSYKFFSWFRLRGNMLILSYGLSSAMIAINFAFTMAFVSNLFFFYVPSSIPVHLGLTYAPFIPPGSIVEMLYEGYFTTSVVSFTLWWIATALLLKHYSQRLGKGKYWLIIALPLTYFLLQFLPSIQDLFSLLPNSPDIFTIVTIIFTISKPVGGVLFGAAFWILVRSLGHANIVKHYMIICAYGLILIFVSNQAPVLLNFSYPPFGLATISFLGLSGYLTVVGVYFSATSVSQDIELRRTIRTYTINQSKLLDDISYAQMQQKIEKTVLDLSKKQEEEMVQQTGLHPSIDEEDMRQYLEDVIREVRDKAGKK
jgi:hypothetical protein